MTPRFELEKRYTGARSNLLFVLALSLLNAVLSFVGSDWTFFFSTTFPMFSIEFFGDEAMAIGVAVALFSLLAYLLCYLLSKKNKGWLIAALVFICLDAPVIFMWEISVFTFVNLGFHAWIIVILISGLRAKSQLDKLPPDDLLAGAVQSIGDAPAEAVDAVSPEQEG